MNDPLVYVDDSQDGELHLSLERRRPHGAMSRIGRLALGAQVFPDFERGDSLPDDLCGTPVRSGSRCRASTTCWRRCPAWRSGRATMVSLFDALTD